MLRARSRNPLEAAGRRDDDVGGGRAVPTSTSPAEAWSPLVNGAGRHDGPPTAVADRTTRATFLVALVLVAAVAGVGLSTRVPLHLVGLALGVVVVAAAYLRPTGAAFLLAALAANAFVVDENVRRGAHAPGLATHQLAIFLAFVIAAGAAAALGRSGSTSASRNV